MWRMVLFSSQFQGSIHHDEEVIVAVAWGNCLAGAIACSQEAEVSEWMCLAGFQLDIQGCKSMA